MRAAVPVVQPVGNAVVPGRFQRAWTIRHFHSPDVQLGYDGVTREIGRLSEIASTVAGLRESRLTPRDGVTYHRPRSAPARTRSAIQYPPHERSIDPVPTMVFRRWRLGHGASSRLLVAEQSRTTFGPTVAFSQYNGVGFYHQNQYGSVRF